MDKLISEIKNRGLSVNRLALETKINPSNLNQAVRGKIPLYPSWRRKIADYLKMDEDDLFPKSETR